jgi:hypothetical protein
LEPCEPEPEQILSVPYYALEVWPQVGLYIIGNGAEMEKNKDRFGRSLKELLSYSKEKRWF